MSKLQRTWFMATIWPDACKAQGWNKSDSEKRYDLFARVLARVPRHAATLAAGGHISFNDFDQADFDKVKAECGRLTDNVAATIETDHPALGERRRLLNNIEDATHCLAICLDEINRRDHKPQLGLEGARAYLRALIKARFPGHTDPETLSPEPVLKDCSSGRQSAQIGPSELERCLYALRTTLNAKRNKAEMSVKDMHLLARNLQPF